MPFLPANTVLAQTDELKNVSYAITFTDALGVSYPVTITPINTNTTINISGNTINGYFSDSFYNEIYYRNKDHTFTTVNKFSEINENTISELIYYKADTTTDVTYSYIASANGQSKTYDVVVTNNWDIGRNELLSFINDANVVPTVPPVYVIAPSIESVDEGSSLLINVSGTNITNGTYYWTVTNTSDFAVSSGSFTISNNAGSFILTPTADATTEGIETFTVSILSGSVAGTVLQTSYPITINDTSKTPALTVTWNTTPISTTKPADSYIAGYGAGTYIAIKSSMSSLSYYTSTDLINWTTRTLPDSCQTSNNFKVIYQNNKFYIWIQETSGSFYRRLYTSTDAINWTLVYNYNANVNINVATNGTNFVITAFNSPHVWTSPDGTTWTYRPNAIPGLRVNSFMTEYGWNTVTNKLIVPNYTVNTSDPYPLYATSDNGVTWTTPINTTQPSGLGWILTQAVAYGNGKFVALQGQGVNTISTSTDGVTWTTPTTKPLMTFTSGIQFGGGLFIANGYSGYDPTTTSSDRVYYSSEGDTWTASNILPEYNITSVYLNNKWISFNNASTNVYIGTLAYV